MTDLEWDAATNPRAMIEFVADYERRPWVTRKLRLFAAAACRLIWNHLTDWRSREAVEGLERWSDGPIRLRRLDALREAADDVWSRSSRDWRYLPVPSWEDLREPREELPEPGRTFARGAAVASDPADPVRGAVEVVRVLGPVVGTEVLAGRLREVCGNPFRRPRGRRWWSADVRGLARGIESGQAFDRMPMLGDALLDAGCESDDAVEHCQSAGRHGLGCWVLDMALGRE
jgi:hypothetical protein